MGGGVPTLGAEQWKGMWEGVERDVERTLGATGRGWSGTKWNGRGPWGEWGWEPLALWA